MDYGFMTIVPLSIRNRLLLLGVVTTVSIWSGAAFQYMQMREQSARLGAVRSVLAEAQHDAELTRLAARERGLTNAFLSRSHAADPTKLAAARRAVDESLARNPSVAARSRAAMTLQMRTRVDRREVATETAFGFYTELIRDEQEIAARRLARAMVSVGFAYEHVIALLEVQEQVALLRGRTAGVIGRGTLDASTESAITRDQALYDSALRRYERSVPDEARMRLGKDVGGEPVRRTLVGVSRLLESHGPAAIGLGAADWWALATLAVDALADIAQRELVLLSERAVERTSEVEWRLEIMLGVMVILGICTLALVSSTVWRVLRGMTHLLDRLDRIGHDRDFAARLDDASSDEFGTMAKGINKLIGIAGNVVGEQTKMGLTDPLTGLANRRAFDVQLAARTTPEREHAPPLSLLMIDVDHFKSVNDTLGHAAGDLVLKGLAAVVSDVLRPDDVLARFGGEEFVALLPGCPLDKAAIVAERIRAAVEAHDFAIDRKITISLGAAQAVHGQSVEKLLEAADERLYLSKKTGRNRVTHLSLVAEAA